MSPALLEDAHVTQILERPDGYSVLLDVRGHALVLPDELFEQLCAFSADLEDAEDDDPREIDDEPEQDDHGGEEYGI